MTREDLVKYWTESSDKDFDSMNRMFDSGDYHWSLYVGHLVIEKLLKAYYVKHADTIVPHVHNLLLIAEKSNLNLNDEQKDFLQTVTRFNIKARYDDFKFQFYKQCTENFTSEWIEKIKEFRIWIKKELMT